MIFIRKKKIKMSKKSPSLESKLIFKLNTLLFIFRNIKLELENYEKKLMEENNH